MLDALSDGPKHRGSATSDSKTSHQSQNIPQPLTVGIPKGVETHKSASDKTDETQYQNKILFWQRFTFWVVAAYAGIAALQWCATRQANQIANRAIYIQNRPWIVVSSIDMKNETVTASAQAFHRELQFNVLLTNYGNFPARKILISTEAKPPDGGANIRHSTWKTPGFCNAFEQAIKSTSYQNALKASATKTIFPKQDGTDVGLYLGKTDGDIAIVNGSPWIAVCVIYESSDGEFHHTQAIYESVLKEDRIVIPGTAGIAYHPIDHFKVFDTDAN